MCNPVAARLLQQSLLQCNIAVARAKLVNLNQPNRVKDMIMMLHTCLQCMYNCTCISIYVQYNGIVIKRQALKMFLTQKSIDINRLDGWIYL